MKIALIHYWFYGMRGGEKVVAEILRLFPKADLFTHLFIPNKLDPIICERHVTTTFINRLPLAGKLYQAYLPLMPTALKRLDLSEYDLIISSESGPAKGVVKRPDACHICYCHTPMRYIWDQQPVYLEQAGILKRWYLKRITPYLRRWDKWSAGQVDHFITNSENVQQRIENIYQCPATIIYPPVAVGNFSAVGTKSDYFIMAGQLVPYKRPDLAIVAFNQLGLPLKVVGTGLELEKLKSLAKNNIEFTGYVSDAELSHLLAGSRALIFPGEEDFGIIPVEAQAAGTPVIALGRGGVLETVNGRYYNDQINTGEELTGLFFNNPQIQDLISAVKKFITIEHLIKPEVCQKQASQFSVDRFRKEFKLFVEDVLPATLLVK
ncbi:MAG: glycosyltransferase [Candidatus Marinimicrobia bacterium]|nr:glycosyltransferase [Candidatus Neomarinimicrobiota bacterium]